MVDQMPAQHGTADPRVLQSDVPADDAAPVRDTEISELYQAVLGMRSQLADLQHTVTRLVNSAPQGAPETHQERRQNVGGSDMRDGAGIRVQVRFIRNGASRHSM